MPAPIPLRFWKGEVVTRWLNDVTEKRCIKCKGWKPYDDKHFQFLATRGHYNSKCRDCARAESREYSARKRAEAKAVRQPVNT